MWYLHVRKIGTVSESKGPLALSLKIWIGDMKKVGLRGGGGEHIYIFIYLRGAYVYPFFGGPAQRNALANFLKQRRIKKTIFSVVKTCTHDIISRWCLKYAPGKFPVWLQTAALDDIG